LNDKARFDPMESQAVVKAGIGQFKEGRRMLRRVFGIEREDEVTLGRAYAHLRGLGALD